MTDERPVLSPTCPTCGREPQWTVGADQAFCGRCGRLTWNPLLAYPKEGEA